MKIHIMKHLNNLYGWYVWIIFGNEENLVLINYLLILIFMDCVKVLIEALLIMWVCNENNFGGFNYLGGLAWIILDLRVMLFMMGPGSIGGLMMHTIPFVHNSSQFS